MNPKKRFWFPKIKKIKNQKSTEKNCKFSALRKLISF